MKKHIFLFGLLLALNWSSFAAEKTVKQAVPAPFTRGVNFSEWLEFKNPEELNPFYITREDFENVQKMGCDVVRLPIHFEQLSSGAPHYTVDPIVWNILDNVAQWSTELKLWVIFDFHNNTANGTTTSSEIENIVTKVWGQVAKRYAGKNPYVCYEVYNEPHGIDKVKWGKVESKVIEIIRTFDKNRYIVVGGAEWNSFDALKSLPKWTDDKLIYTFHFYEPFLFTHQGASWTDLPRIKNIPFPYDSKRMPQLPKNATDTEKWYLKNGDGYNYSQKGTRKAVENFFNQYVDFSLQRNAPVYCGEFGVYMPFAQPEERANWYKIVTDCLAERGIARTSWDYYGSFGVFKSDNGGYFPQDLNKEVVEAMGLKVPKGHTPTWAEVSAQTGEYVLYSNGVGKGVKVSRYGMEGSLYKQDSDGNCVMEFKKMSSYSECTLYFGQMIDFTEFKNQNYYIELTAKNENPNIDFQIRLRDSTEKCQYQWRGVYDIKANNVPVDGEWHTISIPLAVLNDVGAWDNETSTWINSRRAFDWSAIECFQICNNSRDSVKPFYIKDIKITK